MDKILINGLTIYGYHGVNEDEKTKGQPFVLDITAYADLAAACRSDNVNDTISYAQIIKKIKIVFNDRKFDLIEALAQYLCNVLFAEFDRLIRVDLRVTKPRAPILADFDSVAVEISRSRK